MCMLMCMGSGLCHGWLHADVACLSRMQKLLSPCMSSAGSVCMVCMVCVVYGLYGRLEIKLCCEILLLLNMVDTDRWNTVE